MQRLAFALLLGVLGMAATAQDPPADLSALNTRTDVTEEDRGQIRAYVTARLAKIVANDAEARAASEELRAAYDGSEAFKRAYAAVGLELIGPAVKRADLVPATRLVTLVNQFNVVESQALLVELLQDERVGVRAAAVVGLRGLRPKLVAAGRDSYQRVLDALKEAGKREKSRDTLKTIYGAMNFTEVPGAEAKAVAGALLDLLEARGREYAVGAVSAAGADDAGLRILTKVVGSLDEAERKRLTEVVAVMVRYALEQYATGESKLVDVRDKTASREQLELRNGMERLGLVGEELLLALLKPPPPGPDLADALRKADTTPIKLAWEKWVLLLQNATGQNYSLREAPEDASEGAATGDGA